MSAVREYAERGSMWCERSRQDISSCSCWELMGAPLLAESRICWCKYRRDTSGRRKAALIMLVRTAGSEESSAFARCGFVDQTRDEAVGERGKNAMGPVGRKR